MSSSRRDKTDNPNFTVYNVSDFKALRKSAKVKDADLLASLDQPLEALGGDHGGASAASLYLTFDKKFLIKTQLKPEEEGKLKENDEGVTSFLADYRKRIERTLKEGNPSRLLVYYGLYAMNVRGGIEFGKYAKIQWKGSRISMLLMENMKPSSPEKFLKFDLKGVEHRRYVHFGEESATEYLGHSN